MLTREELMQAATELQAGGDVSDFVDRIIFDRTEAMLEAVMTLHNILPTLTKRLGVNDRY